MLRRMEMVQSTTSRLIDMDLQWIGHVKPIINIRWTTSDYNEVQEEPGEGWSTLSWSYNSQEWRWIVWWKEIRMTKVYRERAPLISSRIYKAKKNGKTWVDIKLKFYKTIKTPLVIYSYEKWMLQENNISQLDTREIKFLRWFSGWTRRYRNK